MALYMFPKTKKKKNSLHFRKKVELRATYPADGNHSHMRILLYAREQRQWEFSQRKCNPICYQDRWFSTILRSKGN